MCCGAAAAIAGQRQRLPIPSPICRNKYIGCRYGEPNQVFSPSLTKRIGFQLYVPQSANIFKDRTKVERGALGIN